MGDTDKLPAERVYQGDAISDEVSTDEIFQGKQT